MKYLVKEYKPDGKEFVGVYPADAMSKYEDASYFDECAMHDAMFDDLEAAQDYCNEHGYEKTRTLEQGRMITEKFVFDLCRRMDGILADLIEWGCKVTSNAFYRQGGITYGWCYSGDGCGGARLEVENPDDDGRCWTDWHYLCGMSAAAWELGITIYVDANNKHHAARCPSYWEKH